jgi:hypothetical protein
VGAVDCGTAAQQNTSTTHKTGAHHSSNITTLTDKERETEDSHDILNIPIVIPFFDARSKEDE